MKILTNLDLNYNQLQNFIIQPVSTLPSTGVEGQIIYNSTDKQFYKYDGTNWSKIDTIYILQPATKTQLGGIKVGTGFIITSEGVLSVDAANITAGAVAWEDVTDKPDDLVQDQSYVHTDNNYTTTEKNKLSGISANAQVNVIEKIQKNGEDIDITNKTVNVEVPTQAADISAIPMSDKGKANGVAELDSSGKVLASQLPSYVDDVVEFPTKADFPMPGESGKVYIDIDTGLTYRWGGTTYGDLNPSLALGETAQTAYRGDRGKIAYEHSQMKSGNPHGTTLANLGVTATATELNALPGKVDTLQSSAPDKITGTLAVGSTSVTLSSNTGKAIINTLVYDATTNEEVLCDITYNSGRTTATVNIASAYTNALKVFCVAV